MSKENIDVTGRFSTGMTIYVYKDFASSTAAREFADKLVATNKGLETTQEVLKEWDRNTSGFTIHHLRIRAEYPNETGADRNKIVQYSTLPFRKTVYLIVFESPDALWEKTIEKYGLVLDYVIVFGD